LTLIDRAIACDREQPARKCGRLAELGQPLERDCEHVLHDVGGVGVTHACEHDAMHRAREPPVQLGKRRTIAASRPHHQRRQLVRHRCTVSQLHVGQDGGTHLPLTTTEDAQR
jgi:hypothetical protein